MYDKLFRCNENLHVLKKNDEFSSILLSCFKSKIEMSIFKQNKSKNISVGNTSFCSILRFGLMLLIITTRHVANFVKPLDPTVTLQRVVEPWLNIVLSIVRMRTDV